MDEVAALIEGAEVFPAFEAEVLAAERRILFGMRLFEADLALLTPEARATGARTWAELLAQKAAAGVDVRILLTDFEPIVASNLHEGSWKAVEGFRKAAEAAGAGDRLQIVACTHPGRIGWAARLVFWPALRQRLEGYGGDIRHAPGLWPYLRRSGASMRAKLLPRLRLWPATYHQKMASFDGERAIVGGVDLAERMYDTGEHAQPAEKTWHDLSLAVRGPLAASAARHLHREWNANVPIFNARVTRLGAPFDTMLQPATPIADDPPPAGQSNHRFLRTRSRYNASPFALGPKPDVTEIEAAHLRQIADAERLIYLETQFLRSPAIADALVAAAGRRPDAELIVLTPAAPDDIAFGGSRRDTDASHGEWLQQRAIARIRSAWGDRVGFFCLAQPRLPETPPKYPRAHLAGAPIVYVHAKVSIFDSRIAIVGSANLNGRSLKWDIETAIEWRDAEGAADLQRRLWSMHFAGPPPDAADAPLAAWRARAEANLAADPPDRKGFVMPYDHAAAAADARRSWWIPTNVL